MPMNPPVYADVAGESTSSNDHTYALPASGPTAPANGDWAILFGVYASGSRVVTQNAAGVGGASTPTPTVTEIDPGGYVQSGITIRAWKVKLTAADAGRVISLHNDGGGLKWTKGLAIIRGGHGTDIEADSFGLIASSASQDHANAVIAAAAAYGSVALAFAGDARGASVPNTAAWSAPSGGGGWTLLDQDFCTGTVALTSGALAINAVPVHAGAPGGGGGNFHADQSAFGGTFVVLLKPPNVPPTVSAGVDQVVGVGQAFTLSGEDTDEDGSITSRAWTLDSKPTGAADPTLSGASTATATSSGGAATPGDYVYRYTATDDGGTPSADTMTLHVVTSAPRPNVVLAAGGWTAVGAADIVTALSDEDANSYAESPANPAGAALRVGYPGWVSGQETWTFAHSKSDNSSTITQLVELLCGSVVVDSVTVTSTTTPQTVTRTLTSAQRALIAGRDTQSTMNRRYTATTS